MADLFESATQVVAAFNRYNDVFCGVTRAESQKRLEALRDAVGELHAALMENAPIVCPGCHAVAPDHCAPGCIDNEIEREREDASLYGYGAREEDFDG